MLAEIPIPPIQSAEAWHVFLAAGVAVLAGAAGLLWGRFLHRVLLMLAGAAAAYWFSEPLAQRVGLNLVVVRAASILVMAAAGLILARLVWALLGSAVAACAAVCSMPPPGPAEGPTQPWPVFKAAETLQDWLAEAGRYVGGVAAVQWERQMAALAVAAGVAMVLPLALFLLRPRLGSIFMSALVSAAAAVLAVLAAVGRASTSFWTAAWRHWYVPAALTGLLLAGGLVLQYRGAISEERDKKKREAEPPGDKGKTKKPENAEKD